MFLKSVVALGLLPLVPLADARHITLPDGRRIFGGTPGDGGPDDPAHKQSTQ